MKPGHVYLIGAGPGDPGLISIKALEILNRADCVIYDYLSNHDFIDNLDCEKIYVGKQGGDHTLPQDEINRLLVKKSKDGKTVARLKGGDPFIFGRGGEEAEELLDAGIQFTIVPGVSSFYSAPAYAGIPLTHRDYANSFEVITGHRKEGSAREKINLPEFNKMKTFVFLMGMKNLSYISGQLVKTKKFPKSTPAGIISWGTTAKQEVVTGTLKDIADKADEAGIKAPAIIIVGKVVLLRDRLKWFDNQPLFGKKIVITRTRQQASILSKQLNGLGAGVIEFPTIEIKPKTNQNELKTAINNIQDYNWIIFTSQNAVNIFFDVIKKNGKDARSLHNSRIAAIGPATAAELNKYCLEPDIMPSEFVAEDVLKEMKKSGVKGDRILLPCATEARQTLKEGLVSLGADVDRIHIYNTVIPEQISEEIISDIKSADIITFTSSSTVKNFYSIIENTSAMLASIGPVTSGTLKKLGHEPDIEASEYTIDGLVRAILEYYG